MLPIYIKQLKNLTSMKRKSYRRRSRGRGRSRSRSRKLRRYRVSRGGIRL